MLKLRSTQTPVALLLLCWSRAEAAGVQLCGLDQLCGRLEVAGVEALLRSAAEDRGRTQRKLLQADTQR